MYPNLLGPLLTLAALGAAGLGLLLLRQPVSRRLAARQVARRKLEATLVTTGAVLGTAIIIGALVVGDTLNHSVRQDAYRTLGPVDERVLATTQEIGDAAAARLASLARDPSVDGVLTAHLDQAAASAAGAAEPRVLVWDVDLNAAASFGRGHGRSGLSGPNPEPGQVVLNAPLADSLRVHQGDRITLYLYGSPRSLVVARIVEERGLAGTGTGATINRNAYLAPGQLTALAQAHHQQTRTVSFVSNRGGVESGNALTAQVTRAIAAALGPLRGAVTVQQPKHDVLAAAAKTGDALGALFLMIGSFSIIAGALLLVNIFVMLAEERKTQLGMLRALGMKRSRLVGALTLEGAAYAVAAIVPAIVVGLGVGYGVALVAARIFSSWSQDGTGLTISFAVTPTSIANGVAMGLVIAIATILVTSVRISRFNIISAIRDLPPVATASARRGLTIASTTLAVLVALAAVPSVAASAPVPTLLLPSLAALFAVPLMRRRLSARATATTSAAGVLAWSLVAPVVRPAIFDTPSMAVYVVSGSLVAFSGVILVSQNQQVLLWPVHRLLNRSSQTGLASRLAVAYPLAKRFRTGATLVMYTLIMLVLVLLAEISGIITNSVDRNVADATAGFSLRLDLNPASAANTFRRLTSAQAANDITALSPVTSAIASATDPGHRTASPLRVTVQGVRPHDLVGLRFDRRLAGLPSDRAVWNLLARDPRFVVVDPNFGATGGPNGRFFEPGDTFSVTDPYSGNRRTVTIAGILKIGMAFYPGTGDGATAYPIVASTTAVRQLFGAAATTASALVRTAPGVDPQILGPQLQSKFLASSLVATPIAANTRRMFASSTSFFQLMQGFLALGLLVGVTGLGVVMVRAVRERRRTIGVLRALGFRASTVARSFLFESALVASEGIVLGTVLGVLTTWLMYQKSAAFDGVRAGFPIRWGAIAVMGGATFIASLVATAGPARRAAQVKPAVAVRVAD